MTVPSIYLVMRRRYDDECYRPKMAYNSKADAIATCMELTKKSDIFEYSVLDVPLGYNVEVDVEE